MACFKINVYKRFTYFRRNSFIYFISQECSNTNTINQDTPTNTRAHTQTFQKYLNLRLQPWSANKTIWPSVFRLHLIKLAAWIYHATWKRKNAKILMSRWWTRYTIQSYYTINKLYRSVLVIAIRLFIRMQLTALYDLWSLDTIDTLSPKLQLFSCLYSLIG